MDTRATTIRVAASSERAARDIALQLGSYVYNVQQVGAAEYEVTYS